MRVGETVSAPGARIRAEGIGAQDEGLVRRTEPGEVGFDRIRRDRRDAVGADRVIDEDGIARRTRACQGKAQRNQPAIFFGLFGFVEPPDKLEKICIVVARIYASAFGEIGICLRYPVAVLVILLE